MLTYPLVLYRGDTYRRQFTVWADAAQTTAVDLTDVLVAAEIRAGTGTTPVYALALTVTLPNVIDLEISAAQSAQLPAAATWDLQLTYPSTDVQTIVKGGVSVQGDVTGSLAVAATGTGCRG
jgi:hypothetical protein